MRCRYETYRNLALTSLESSSVPQKNPLDTPPRNGTANITTDTYKCQYCSCDLDKELKRRSASRQHKKTRHRATLYLLKLVMDLVDRFQLPFWKQSDTIRSKLDLYQL